MHQGAVHDAPSDALVSQPKVEFPKMAHCVLFVPPPGPLANCAKAALKPVLGDLKKPMICQKRLEASQEVHILDLGKLEATKESSQGDPVLENYGNPLAGELRTTTQPAQCFKFDRVGLVLDRWLLSGLVIDSPDRLLPFVDNTGLVACYSAGLMLDLICGGRERRRRPLRLSIGNQRNFKGICLHSCGSRGELMETSQKSSQSIRRSELTHIGGTTKQRDLE